MQHNLRLYVCIKPSGGVSKSLPDMEGDLLLTWPAAHAGKGLEFRISGLECVLSQRQSSVMARNFLVCVCLAVGGHMNFMLHNFHLN